MLTSPPSIATLTLAGVIPRHSNTAGVPHFGGPNNQFGTAAFGRITPQVNIARQLQLALKFIW